VRLLASAAVCLTLSFSAALQEGLAFPWAAPEVGVIAVEKTAKYLRTDQARLMQHLPEWRHIGAYVRLIGALTALQ
jgi:hypothetical protein